MGPYQGVTGIVGVRAMKKWLRRIYGQYKLNQACIYIAREAKIARWARKIVTGLPHAHQLALQYEQALLDAGGILLEARQRCTENVQQENR